VLNPVARRWTNVFSIYGDNRVLSPRFHIPEIRRISFDQVDASRLDEMSLGCVQRSTIPSRKPEIDMGWDM
jgi:hypothetical protein